MLIASSFFMYVFLTINIVEFQRGAETPQRLSSPLATDFSVVRQLTAHSSVKNTGFSVACQLTAHSSVKHFGLKCQSTEQCITIPLIVLYEILRFMSTAFHFFYRASLTGAEVTGISFSSAFF